VSDPLIDERATSMMRAAMPFTATLGVEVLYSTKDEVRSRLLWHESLATSGGILHGGALMASATVDQAASS
jgi:1,4-dihydroxy-2-naphthoyl-CoA hydrolase